jgi:DNA-binding transcriptional MerR regulator
MPTLQRYKKEFQARIPSKGEGRKQRYPEEALEVFKTIKKENVGRRGRPKKSESGKGKGKKPGRKKAAASTRGRGRGRKPAAKPEPAAAGGGDLLTLTEISKRTGISYPTLSRYVKLHLGQIPHEGKGRSRRYHPEAVEVFNRLRQQSSRGPRGGRKAAGAAKAPAGRMAAGDGALGRRVQALERSHASLEKEIKALLKQLKKPITVTVSRK